MDREVAVHVVKIGAIGGAEPGVRELRSSRDRRGDANRRIAMSTDHGDEHYFDTTTAGGFQVPSPGGRIDGGVSFGQYRRITR